MLKKKVTKVVVVVIERRDIFIERLCKLAMLLLLILVLTEREEKR